MIMWGFIILLAIAVAYLMWLHMNSQVNTMTNVEQQHLEEKVLHLEQNLKKTLEIMQDLAKKMHAQQDALEKTVQRTQQLELQNAELVSLLAKTVEAQMHQNH